MKKKKQNPIRNLVRSLLKKAIRIEKIPFTDNGQPKEFCTFYAFDKKVGAGVFDGKEEKDELCEYLGII